MPLDLPALRLEKTLTHDRQLISCRYSADAERLFAAGFDGRLYRWRLADGQTQSFEAHRGWVEAMLMAPDRQRLYTADSWGRVCCWPLTGETLTPVWSIAKACGSWLRSAALSPDGELLATCGNEPVVRVYSTADGKLLHELRGHKQPVFSVAFHPGGKLLASGDLHGIVREWQISEGRCTRTLEAKPLFTVFEHYRQGGVRAMAFDVSGKTLYCAGFAGTNANQAQGVPTVVPLDWEMKTPRETLSTGEAFNGPILDVVYHPEGFLIAAGSSEAGGRLWFWKPGEVKASHTVKFNTSFRRMDLDSTGTRLAVVGFGDLDGQRGGNGRRLNKNGEYSDFGGTIALYSWQPTKS